MNFFKSKSDRQKSLTESLYDGAKKENNTQNL